jgi:hypothetical protein
MKKTMTTMMAVALLAALAAQGAAVEHWSVPAMSAVMRLDTTEPKDGEKGGPVEYVVTPGEITGGSFVLKADADLKDVTLAAEGDFAAAMDPHVVKLWYQAGSAWYGYFADSSYRKLVPELLLHDETLVEVDHRTKDNYVRYVNTDGIERRKWMSANYDVVDYTFAAQANQDLIADAETLQPFALDAGRFKQFMVQFRVPADARDGLYRGKYVVRKDGKVLAEVPYAVRVLPFTLPDPKTFYNPDKGFYLMMYGTEPRSEKIARNLHEHGCFTPMGVPRVDPMNPRKFKEDVELYKKIGFPMKPVFFGVIGSGTRVMGDEPTPEETAKLEHARDTIQKVRKLLDETLGHHDFYSYGVDEGGPTVIRQERANWRITHEAGGKVGVSTRAWRELLFALDFMILPGMPSPHRAEEVRKFHESNPDALCGWYANPHTGPENPDYFRRIHGLLAWQTGYDVSANYCWWRNNWNDMATPYEPELRGLVIVYGTKDDVIDTLAWEGVREGMNDVRYATLARNLALEAAKSDDADTLLLGRRVLSHMAYWDSWREDPEAFRFECINFILRLRKALKIDGVKG